MMQLKSVSTLTLAACLVSAPLAALAQGATDSSQPHVTGRREAAVMVPATVMLLGDIDSRKLHEGALFEAKLARKVRLNNGTELPSGTVFEGTIAADDMNVQGTSKLALRFTSAKLKDGQAIPIKATIVAVYTPQNQDLYSDSYDRDYPTPVPNSWNDGTLAEDQVGVIKGVDLHSRISSQNSGVLVSSSKDEVKLPRGTDLSLALASGNGQSASAVQAGSGTGIAP